MAINYSHGMKTTLNINDAVMRQVKREAAKRGCTMGSLIESALRLFLKEARMPPAKLPPLPTFHGGRELVDVADREALHDVLNEEKYQRLYGRRKRDTQ